MNARAKKHSAAPQAASTAEQATLPRLIKASLRGIAVGLGTILLLSLVGTLIAYQSVDPNALLTPLALACLAIGCLATGFTARCNDRSPAWLCGIVCSLGLLIALWLFSICLPDGLRRDISSGMRWGVYGGAVAFCLLGALMAANRPRAKRVKHKKRK